MRDEFDAPLLPADVEASDLASEARMQLKTLDKENADVVARHLAMVERLIDDDPALAHQHALAASRRAGRIGVVRETLAITAYHLEDFGLALRELRTFRRITGSDEQLPLMVDCERGLGRPEKALELSRSVDASTLPTPVRVELAIARSGARLDLGQTQAALDELRIPELQRDVAHSYSPALFAAFATVLEELGRTDEAAEWITLADRAIDALQAAADPGDAETVRVTEEWIDVPDLEDDEDADAAFDAEDAGPEGAGDPDAGDVPARDEETAEERLAPVDEAPTSDEIQPDAVATDDAQPTEIVTDDAQPTEIVTDEVEPTEIVTDEVEPTDGAEDQEDADDEPVDTSAAAIEAEVEALLAGVQDTTTGPQEPASTDADDEPEVEVALFAIEPEDAGESASELAESEAALADEAAPDAPAHEADEDDATEEPRA